jgi:hypothetical protein
MLFHNAQRTEETLLLTVGSEANRCERLFASAVRRAVQLYGLVGRYHRMSGRKYIITNRNNAVQFYQLAE